MSDNFNNDFIGPRPKGTSPMDCRTYGPSAVAPEILRKYPHPYLGASGGHMLKDFFVNQCDCPTWDVRNSWPTVVTGELTSDSGCVPRLHGADGQQVGCSQVPWLATCNKE